MGSTTITVTTVDGNFTSTSEVTVEIDPVLSVSPTSPHAELSVYPNPVQNSKVIIEDGTLKNGKVYYSLYSISGSNVLSGEYLVEANSSIELDLDKSFIKPGVYYLMLISDRYKVPKKIRLIID